MDHWSMSEDSKRLHYGSPVMPIEYEPDGEPIWPCTQCLPWHIEIILTAEEPLLIREWHAVDCPVLADDPDGIPSTE
jgi:hypothetical protein